MRSDEQFSPLRIVKKNITDFDRSAYRVYKSPKEYVTVEAATALEAFRESGIEKPLRILRETRFMDRLVAENRFSEMEEIIETGLVMAPPPSVAGHKEAVPPAQSTVSAAMDTIPDAPEQAAEAEWQPTPPQPKQAAAPTASQAPAPAETPVAAEAPAAESAEAVEDADELSEDDIQKLLGEDEQAEAAGKDGDELSEEEIAKLLDGE